MNTASSVVAKRILFVDDDLEFLQMIERFVGLWSNNTIEVLTAQNATAALGILNETVPDLIVLDVCMPVVDGLQLLGLIRRRFPETPKVVLTSQPDEAYRTACLNNGAELFLEKPSTAEGFEAVFATLDELTRWKPETGFRGTLRSVGLTDVLQMECIAKTSSIMSVSSKDQSGAIYIEEGAIIHAEAGTLKGEEAFKALIALVSGDFRSLPFNAPPERTIDLPWETLLMDAAQARDELLGAPRPEPAIPEPDPCLDVAQSFQRPREEAAPPIEIEELLICSEAGDVYHAWQCTHTELRIHLLKALTQQADSLRAKLPVGSLDRAEFIAPGWRLIAKPGADRGIVVRTSLSGVAVARDDSASGNRQTAQARTHALSWFEKQDQLPGLFAAVLHFNNGETHSHVRAPQYTPETLGLLRSTANDAFTILQGQRFHAQRTRWTFEHVTIEFGRWRDGTILSLVFNQRAHEINAVILEEQMGAFLGLEEA
jgi:CheY-like chemotaxis protein